ncbi:hypothetical protein J42TS3_42460 [Paenibacillus vini]|uniref:Uncharacterized protein n=1 Tax=Paenibacillus vini TaxID=1476024 RepID=A0ABQ4MGW0_9BACL|nr:hypothetical protein J42TS3_42460 [Paenibacillus vini]
MESRVSKWCGVALFIEPDIPTRIRIYRFVNTVRRRTFNSQIATNESYDVVRFGKSSDV